MTNLVLPNLSFVVCGVAFKVHREVGRYEREKVYRETLGEALLAKGLVVRQEFPVAVNISPRITKKRYLDLLVEEVLAIEVKASEEIFSVRYLDQLRSYLQEAKIPLGLLINFSRFRLSPIRVLNPEFSGVDLSTADQAYHSLRFDKIRGTFRQH